MILNFDQNFLANLAPTSSALHLTACKGNFETAALLLLNGSDANKRDLNGNSPLHLAVLSNHIQMVTLLLKNGANIKEVDNAGR